MSDLCRTFGDVPKPAAPATAEGKGGTVDTDEEGLTEVGEAPTQRPVRARGLPNGNRDKLQLCVVELAGAVALEMT